MADRVDQYFVKVHFHKMTTEYSNKIVDKEAGRISIVKDIFCVIG